MPGLRARKKFYQWQVLHEVSQVRGLRSTGTVPTKSTTIKITDMKKTASSLNTWLNKESKTFSIICGERFTHAEVIMTHIVALVMLAVAVAAGSVLG
jgi:hypothetical protein